MLSVSSVSAFSPRASVSPAFRPKDGLGFGNQPAASAPPTAVASPVPQTATAGSQASSASSTLMGITGNGRNGMPMSRFFFIGAFIAAGSMAMHGLIENAIPWTWKLLVG